MAGSPPETSLPELDGSVDVVVGTDGLRLAMTVISVLFDRKDLNGSRVGLALYARSSEPMPGRLLWLQLRLNGSTCQFETVGTTEEVDETILARRLSAITGMVVSGRHSEMATLVTRCGYAGENTIEILQLLVRVGIDECVLCDNDGLLIIG